MTQIKDIDPNAPRFIEFDWELLRRALGEAKEETTETDFALLGQILGELLRWVVRNDKPASIARRAVALAWVMNPDIFKGASTAKLSRILGCHFITFRNETAEASRVFNHRNRAQNHAWNFKK